MYSMDDLLHLLHSDGADGLKLHVGEAPILILDGREQRVEGPEITEAMAEELFQSVSDTRQRRELRERGSIEFIYRFRGRACFVVRARKKEDHVDMEIH